MDIMNELREKIDKLLDEFTTKEMLEKAYKHILFIYIYIFNKEQK